MTHAGRNLRGVRPAHDHPLRPGGRVTSPALSSCRKPRAPSSDARGIAEPGRSPRAAHRRRAARATGSWPRSPRTRGYRPAPDRRGRIAALRVTAGPAAGGRTGPAGCGAPGWGAADAGFFSADSLVNSWSDCRTIGQMAQACPSGARRCRNSISVSGEDLDTLRATGREVRRERIAPRGRATSTATTGSRASCGRSSATSACSASRSRKSYGGTGLGYLAHVVAMEEISRASALGRPLVRRAFESLRQPDAPLGHRRRRKRSTCRS